MHGTQDVCSFTCLFNDNTFTTIIPSQWPSSYPCKIYGFSNVSLCCKTVGRFEYHDGRVTRPLCTFYYYDLPIYLSMEQIKKILFYLSSAAFRQTQFLLMSGLYSKFYIYGNTFPFSSSYAGKLWYNGRNIRNDKNTYTP